MAAVVNGDPITLDQFNRYITIKNQVQVVVDPARLQAGSDGRLIQQPYSGQVVASLGLQALTDLVQQTIIKQVAKDQGVYPTDQQVNDELADRSKANPSFLRNLVDAGFTTDMVRNDIAVELAQFNLTTQGIKVGDDEVRKYIVDHPDEFKYPESVDMIWMLVPDDKTRKLADADLKAGQSFVVVAGKYTTAPNARQMQYRFPEQYVPRLVNYGPELKPAVDKTSPQQQTDWIKFTEGWAKFYINKKSPARAVPIDDNVIKQQRRKMALQRGLQGKDLDSRIQDKLKNSKVEVMITYLQAPWQRSVDSLNSSTATTGAAKP